MNVLVTDGNNRAALAITRSLGRQGYKVYVGSVTKPSIAGSSRHCFRNLCYTDPGKSPIQFQRDIEAIVLKENIRILIPAAELTTLQCVKIKSKLKNNCDVPFQSYDSVDRAASKYHVLKIAEELKIPIPETYFMHAIDDLGNVIEFCKRIGFPVVIKASRSRVLSDQGLVNTSARYAYNEKEIIEICQSQNNKNFPLLVQERIYGDGVGLFACYDNGADVAYFGHRRIREKPPSGGVSVMRESYAIDEKLKSYADALLKELKWHGVAMVEFKKDEKNNCYKLMEINGRFWGSLQLAIDAGVDFPLILAKISEKSDVAPVSNYKLMVKTRWLLGDVDAFIVRLLKNHKKLNLPEGYPTIKQHLRDLLECGNGNWNLEVLKVKDPMPWIIEFLKWIRVLP